MPSANNVQILKESKARFEGVILNQTADLGTNKSTSCKVIDEATGEVIAQSGGGGESDFVSYSVELTVVDMPELNPPMMSCPIINQDKTIGNYMPLSQNGTIVFNVVSTTDEAGAAMLIFTPADAVELSTTTEDVVAVNENIAYVFGDGAKISVTYKDK